MTEMHVPQINNPSAPGGFRAFTGDRKRVTVIQYFLIFLVGIIVATLGWSAVTVGRLRENVQPAATAPVSVENAAVLPELSYEQLIQSGWSGPLLMVVERPDGSYAYAHVEDGYLKDGRYVGDVTIAFENGDHGIVTEDKNGVIPIFISKANETSGARFVQHMLLGVKLPDGSILPVQFTDARVMEGKLYGSFAAITDVDRVLISGNRSAIGDMLSFSVVPTLQVPDTLTSMLSRAVLLLLR